MLPSATTAAASTNPIIAAAATTATAAALTSSSDSKAPALSETEAIAIFGAAHSHVTANHVKLAVAEFMKFFDFEANTFEVALYQCWARSSLDGIAKRLPLAESGLNADAKDLGHSNIKSAAVCEAQLRRYNDPIETGLVKKTFLTVMFLTDTQELIRKYSPLDCPANLESIYLSALIRLESWDLECELHGGVILFHRELLQLITSTKTIFPMTAQEALRHLQLPMTLLGRIQQQADSLTQAPVPLAPVTFPQVQPIPKSLANPVVGDVKDAELKLGPVLKPLHKEIKHYIANINRPGDRRKILYFKRDFFEDLETYTEQDRLALFTSIPDFYTEIDLHWYRLRAAEFVRLLPLLHGTKITSADFSVCKLGRIPDAALMVGALSAQITTLHLESNMLFHLGMAFAEPTTPTEPHLKPTTVPLTEQGLQHFFRQIKAITVFLADNDFGSVKPQDFAMAFAGFGPHVTTVDLSKNRLRIEHLRAIIPHSIRNQTLILRGTFREYDINDLVEIGLAGKTLVLDEALQPAYEKALAHALLKRGVECYKAGNYQAAIDDLLRAFPLPSNDITRLRICVFIELATQACGRVSSRTVVSTDAKYADTTAAVAMTAPPAAKPPTIDLASAIENLKSLISRDLDNNKFLYVIAKYLVLLKAPQKDDPKQLPDDDFFINFVVYQSSMEPELCGATLQLLLDSNFRHATLNTDVSVGNLTSRARDFFLAKSNTDDFAGNFKTLLNTARKTHPHLVFRARMQMFMPESHMGKFATQISRTFNGITASLADHDRVLEAAECDAFNVRYQRPREYDAQNWVVYSKLSSEIPIPALVAKVDLSAYHPKHMLAKVKTIPVAKTSVNLASTKLYAVGSIDLQEIFPYFPAHVQHVDLSNNNLAYLRESRLPLCRYLPDEELLFISRSHADVARNLGQVLNTLQHVSSFCLARNRLNILGADGVIVVIKDLKNKKIDLSGNDFHLLPVDDKHRLMKFLLKKKDEDGVDFTFDGADLLGKPDPFHQEFMQYQQARFYQRLQLEMQTQPMTSIVTTATTSVTVAEDTKKLHYGNRLTAFGMYKGAKSANQLVLEALTHYEQLNTNPSKDRAKDSKALGNCQQTCERLFKQCPIESLAPELFSKWLDMALDPRFWKLSISLCGNDAVYQTHLSKQIMQVRERDPMLWQRACVQALMTGVTLLGRVFDEGYGLSRHHPLTYAESPLVTTILPALQDHAAGVGLAECEKGLLKTYEKMLKAKLVDGFGTLVNMLYPEPRKAVASSTDVAEAEPFAEVRNAVRAVDMHCAL